MRLGRLFGIPIRLNPISIPMAALALWLGEGEQLLIMTGSVLFHELMHVAAARMLRVRVLEMELMPVGGAARLENLWRLRPGQVMTVAFAGPAGNLLLVVLAAAFCWWNILPPRFAAAVIEQNLIIFFFNMLPALPMDGGRILCGLLSRRMSQAGAAKAGTFVGLMLSATLGALSVYGLIRGRLNITLPAAAIFLAFSARREREQAVCAAIESLTGRAAELRAEGALPMRLLAVGVNTPVREAAVRMKPRYMHMIAVYDDNLALTGIVEEAALAAALMEDGERKMREIGRNVKKKVF